MQAGENEPLTSLCNYLHIVIIKQTPDDRVEVIGTQSVEWRRVRVCVPACVAVCVAVCVVVHVAVRVAVCVATCVAGCVVVCDSL